MWRLIVVSRLLVVRSDIEHKRRGTEGGRNGNKEQKVGSGSTIRTVRWCIHLLDTAGLRRCGETRLQPPMQVKSRSTFESVCASQSTDVLIE